MQLSATRFTAIASLLAVALFKAATQAHAVELSGIAHVSAGSAHTCAVTTSGAVKCWGYSQSGQLGDGSVARRSTPVNVKGLATRIVEVSAGAHHTCAATASGTVKCWGVNASGQLGDHGTAAQVLPRDVSGISDALALSAGETHTCALTMSGGVKCWGHLRAVGVVDAVSSSPPVEVTGLSAGVVSIAAGNNFTCALLATGAVRCWGVVGNGGFGPATPIAVSGLDGRVVAIASAKGLSTRACALLDSGRVKCWLPRDLDQTAPTPAFVATDVADFGGGAVALAASSIHLCVITRERGVRCLGENSSGQLGDGSISNRAAPIDVVNLAQGVVEITVSTLHTCALLADGRVKCWGNDGNAQLGDQFEPAQVTPVDVVGLNTGTAADVTSIAAGWAHTCAVTAAGAAKCWGYDDSGQLGDNSPYGYIYSPAAVRPRPVDVTSLSTGVRSISTGDKHSCALMADARVKCWGTMADPVNLSRPPFRLGLVPTDVVGLPAGVTSVSSGSYHACALTESSDVWCWGTNEFGQLGHAGQSTITPIRVAGLAGTASISAGGRHTCALSRTGQVKCWGHNSNGQLGDDSEVSRPEPADVAGLASDIIAITSGPQHTCSLNSAGGVKCWGNNTQGQLGDGSSGFRSRTPVDVLGLVTGVQAIAASSAGASIGGAHTCAVLISGIAKCWGINSAGQLGDGTRIDRRSPVDVAGLKPGVKALAVGGEHTCAITAAGALQCWGAAYYGQLGDGHAGTQRMPVAVVTPDNAFVVEFYNPVLEHYFITADADEALAVNNGAAGPGWSRTGGRFKSGGAIDVCRFYGSQSPGPNSHVYALDGSECQRLMDAQFSAVDPRRTTVKSWNFEGFDFASTRPVNGVCASGLVPVYRAYNNGFARGVDSNHRITIDRSAIAQVVARDWIDEGVVMCATQ